MAKLREQEQELTQAHAQLQRRLTSLQESFAEKDAQLAQLVASHSALGRGAARLLHHEARNSTLQHVLHAIPGPEAWSSSTPAARWSAPHVRFAIHSLCVELGAKLRCNAPVLEVRGADRWSIDGTLFCRVQDRLLPHHGAGQPVMSVTLNSTHGSSGG